MTTRDGMNLSAVAASAAVASVLLIAKLWAFAATGALSVAASLADSGLDLLMALGGLAALRYAQRPPDDDHAFGHSSAEDLAALGQSLFILVSAAVIGVSAVGRLTAPSPTDLRNEEVGLVVMGLSVALTVALVAYQTAILRRTGNRVVSADRLHYLGDLAPNLGAIFALLAADWFALGQIDSIVALAAAGLMAVGAVGIGRGAWHALMDRAAPTAMVRGIEAIAAETHGIHGCHDLKTRQSGSRTFVNLHVEIDGTLPLREAHDIGEALRCAIVARYPDADVIIHKDPV